MTLEELPLETALVEPHKIVGRIETDMFCVQCHYNLHGLDVRQDQRLDIAIIRCPECGKIHPAGVAIGAGRVWLHRLARFLIAIWVSTVMAVIAACAFFMFLVDMISFDAFTHYDRQAMGMPGMVWVRRPMTAADFDAPEQYFLAHLLFVAMCAGLGWILGSFLSTFLSQVRRCWHLWTLALPLCAGLLSANLFFMNLHRYAPGTRGWAISMVAWLMAWQVLCIVLGIVAGRPVARLLARAILTRRLLQYLRFLWEVDGKTPPALIKTS